MSWIGDALNAIQLKPRFLFGIALACVLVLVLPADAMGLAWLVPFRGWVSLVAILAFCFWIVQLIPLLQKRHQQAKQKAAVLVNLDSLSLEEATLLRYCLHRNKKTMLLELQTFEANVAAGLRQKGLIAAASGILDVMAFPHMIPEFVWQELLRRRNDLLPPNNEFPAEMAKRFKELDDVTSGRGRRIWR